MKLLLALLFWASLLGGALSIFLDPDFPSIFEIIERF